MIPSRSCACSKPRSAATTAVPHPPSQRPPLSNSSAPSLTAAPPLPPTARREAVEVNRQGVLQVPARHHLIPPRVAAAVPRSGDGIRLRRRKQNRKYPHNKIISNLELENRAPCLPKLTCLSTPFIIRLKVEVLCFLFLTQPVCMVPNQDTRNLYLQVDDKRCARK